MKKNITEYNYVGKKVIIRCDLNVPILNGKITDDTRIKESLHSIKYLIEKKAKIIILSHLGKVKTEEDKKANTLYPVYLRLKELLNTEVYFSKELTGRDLEINVKGKNSLVSSVSLVNEEIKEILYDINITTKLKEQIDKVLFSDIDVRKKRIAIRKLKRKGLDSKYIKIFINLLEYIQKI